MWFRKSLAEHPNDTPRNRAIVLAAIASAQALAGRTADAQATAAEAVRLWPLLTVRGYYETDFPMSPINVAQVSRMRDGLRLAGLRNHADGDADNELDPDDTLHTAYEGLTPNTAPGAKTIRTPELVALPEQQKPS